MLKKSFYYSFKHVTPTKNGIFNGVVSIQQPTLRDWRSPHVIYYGNVRGGKTMIRIMDKALLSQVWAAEEDVK